ncbi:Cupredoxin [Radiomyces spectabilis]|uniref:Cupredoxin n=1 Tax=Radiomyces spectabilis TaxID=64574 RepID=UPI00222117D7|nr:Cupredoxin [Radiomyces spectabilis]KAI8388069.1 Cupredoxin [Radiomyces spectabilis]
MKKLLHFIVTIAALLVHVQAQDTAIDEQDAPEPYVPPPVKYTDNFHILHDELTQPHTGITRTYYIAVDEVVWDYLPDGNDTIFNTSINDSPAKSWISKCKLSIICNYVDSEAHIYLVVASTTIGARYHKALYREYTDDSYRVLKPRPHWQGLMGPVLRGEVGDTLEIHFWNRASYNFSMHPHGVLYEFEMEGAVYKGTSNTAFVRPGEKYTYRWEIYPRAGPGPSDGNSLVWGYHSHVTENDIYAGLYGAIIVYKPGTLTEDSVKDEIVTSLFASNENLSPYLDRTMAELAPQLDLQAIQENRMAFRHSNNKQSINGLMFSAPRDLIIPTSKTIQWHLLGWGSMMDLQDIRWEHGAVTLFDKPVSHIRLYPATFRTVQVKADQKGDYQFGFINGQPGIRGMIMRYKVV